VIRPNGLTVGLASGLTVSALLLAARGGWPGAVIGAAQLAAAVALLLRPVRPTGKGTLAVAALALVPAPVLALRHWTAGLPLVCQCSGPAKPAPGLLSLTGLAVAIDLALLVLAIGPVLAARRRVGALR
jgi:hypothetical protein